MMQSRTRCDDTRHQVQMTRHTCTSWLLLGGESWNHTRTCDGLKMLLPGRRYKAWPYGKKRNCSA